VESSSAAASVWQPHHSPHARQPRSVQGASESAAMEERRREGGGAARATPACGEEEARREKKSRKGDGGGALACAFLRTGEEDLAMI